MRGYAGANVTLPHKEAALAAADRRDEAATTIGAANTLWLDDEGALHAGNSDAYGFMTHLAERLRSWNGSARPVMVLGAGGAARAILYGLIEAGSLADPHRQPQLRAGRSAGRRFGAPRGGCSVGGPRRGALRLQPSRQRHEPRHDGKATTRNRPLALPPDAVVADIVYNPLETPLLLPRRARGETPRGWARHAAAPSGAGLRTLVRRPAASDARAPREYRREAEGGLDAGHRPHRFDRHGKIDRGEPIRAARRAGFRRRRGSAPALCREGRSSGRGVFPNAVQGGVVDRVLLAAEIAGAPEKLAQLEAIVHPLVVRRRSLPAPG